MSDFLVVQNGRTIYAEADGSFLIQNGPFSIIPAMPQSVPKMVSPSSNRRLCQGRKEVQREPDGSCIVNFGADGPKFVVERSCDCSYFKPAKEKAVQTEPEPEPEPEPKKRPKFKLHDDWVENADEVKTNIHTGKAKLPKKMSTAIDPSNLEKEVKKGDSKKWSREEKRNG